VPVLKKLVLKSVKFKLDALEEMHRNIPSIQDLSLDEMTVIKGDMPLDIIPATCITKLKFSADSIFGARTLLQVFKSDTNSVLHLWWRIRSQ
jgi:hypothetical protein